MSYCILCWEISGYLKKKKKDKKKGFWCFLQFVWTSICSEQAASRKSNTLFHSLIHFNQRLLSHFKGWRRASTPSQKRERESLGGESKKEKKKVLSNCLLLSQNYRLGQIQASKEWVNPTPFIYCNCNWHFLICV